MDMTPRLFLSDVMHKRLLPKVNEFTYGVYYLAFPLSKLDDLPLPVNRFGAMSFYEKDHGLRDGSSLENWARRILNHYNIDKADGEIVLISLPRILGYVFNPVSFWVCHDKAGAVRAVICEVNNTFGETHTYLCAHDDQRVISKDDWLQADKLFHVSPFLKREGYYKFRFAFDQSGQETGRAGIWITYYNGSGDRQLLTALTGRFRPMTTSSLRQVFWRYPLVTLKTIALIHWQAIKLLSKGIRYVVKPDQIEPRHSATGNLKKN